METAAQEVQNQKEKKVRGQFCGVLSGSNGVKVFYKRPHFLLAKENGDFIRFVKISEVKQRGIYEATSGVIVYGKNGCIGPSRYTGEDRKEKVTYSGKEKND